MPKLAGVQHQRAVKAFEKAGFRVVREGKHISMAKDDRIVIIPRNNPINAFTMAGIIKDAGLTIEVTRQIRDDHAKHLAGKTHAERIAFYRERAKKMEKRIPALLKMIEKA